MKIILKDKVLFDLSAAAACNILLNAKEGMLLNDGNHPLAWFDDGKLVKQNYLNHDLNNLLLTK